MVSENAVMIIGRRGCCMCHVVKRLLQGLGVNPPVYEVHEDHETAVARHLSVSDAETLQFPAVFLAGKFFGGLERVMATHISGELVPILKDAGALWL
uniref:Glutaredoxin-C9 n=2 Tax=Cajanus cajan TaxID=3821 RepID=A0A151SAP1_CAJCA|nr:Glutaredoxin-C9 [Cajanus cajan]